MRGRKLAALGLLLSGLAGQILTEIVLLFANSDLPTDFYVASILLCFTIGVFFSEFFPQISNYLKRLLDSV